MLEIKMVDKTDWNADLQRFNPGCLMSTKWIEGLANENMHSKYFNFIRGEKTIGKIGGFLISPDNAGKRHLFFYSGPLTHDDDPKLAGKMVEKIIRYANSIKCNRVVIRSYDYDLSLPKRIKRFKVSERVEYIMDISGTPKDVSARFHKGARHKVRAAQKKYNAKLFETQSEVYLDRLIDLLEETRKIRLAKGYDDYNYYYLPHMHKEVARKLLKNNLARIYYTESMEGEVNCIRYDLLSKPRVYGLYIGCNSSAYAQHLPNFIHYHVSLKLNAEGYTQIGIGGLQNDSSTQKLAQFKKSLGAIKTERTGGSTNYLIAPKRILNPVLTLARFFPDISITRKLKKKFL